MPDMLTLALGVLFVAGTLLHTLRFISIHTSMQEMAKEVTAHDANDIEGGDARKG